MTFRQINLSITGLFLAFLIGWRILKEFGFIPDGPAWFYFSRIEIWLWILLAAYSLIFGISHIDSMTHTDRFTTFAVPLVFYGIILASNSFVIIQMNRALEMANKLGNIEAELPKSTAPSMVDLRRRLHAAIPDSQRSEIRSKAQSRRSSAVFVLVLATLTVFSSAVLGFHRRKGFRRSRGPGAMNPGDR